MRRGPRIKTLLAAVLVAAGLLVLFAWNPAVERFFPPCPFHYLTGWHCAGCGSLRAAHQLLHGRLFEAFRLNPLMVVSIPFLAALVWRPAWGARRWAPWVALAVVVAYSILRNLPFHPFNLLAPSAL